MLLHIAFPWLLGPLWNDWARDNRARWYGAWRAGDVLLGLAMLLAWAFRPASAAAMRIVTAVLHADGWARGQWRSAIRCKVMRAVLVVRADSLPVLLFPFSGWPRAWVALATLRRPLDTGLRFALCWLVPVFVVFSIISGKQLYYPLPEFGWWHVATGGALCSVARAAPGAGRKRIGWARWPLGVGGICVRHLPVRAAVSGCAPTTCTANGSTAPRRYSRYFQRGCSCCWACLLLLRGRGEMRRVAVAGLFGVLALNTLFTLTLWHNYDLSPARR